MKPGQQQSLLPTANQLTADILLAIPKRFPNVRAWRRNVGGGYPVQTVKAVLAMLRDGRTQEAIQYLIKARPVMFGQPGEPDIDGLCGPDGRRLGIEVKATGDRQREEQKVCEQVWRRHGAIYLIAEDVDKALDDLSRELGA